MERVEVVCVTMGQKGLAIADKMHITGDAVFGNQADGFRKEVQTRDGQTVKMITTDTRGVGVNRIYAATPRASASTATSRCCTRPGISCFLPTMISAMPTVMPTVCAAPMRSIRMRI